MLLTPRAPVLKTKKLRTNFRLLIIIYHKILKMQVIRTMT